MRRKGPGGKDWCSGGSSDNPSHVEVEVSVCSVLVGMGFGVAEI